MTEPLIAAGRRPGDRDLLSESDWAADLLIAVGSALGGQIGAKADRRLAPADLRAVIVVAVITIGRPLMD